MKIKTLSLSVLGAFAIVTTSFAKPVSVNGYNIITSEEKIKKIVFPKNAKLSEDPVFSSDYKSVLVSFPKKSEGEVYYVNVETKDGVFKVKLEPTSSVPPQVIKVGGDKSDLPVSSEGNPNRFFLPLIASIVGGKAPKGYRESISPDVDYGYFDAVAEQAWENGKFEIVLYHLVPKKDVFGKIDPSQFYEAGVRAVSLSDEKILKNGATKLIIVREKRG